jgi:hypothetical protein
VLLQALAGGVDVVDRIREMAEIAAAAVGLGLPVVRELDLRGAVAGRGEEDERELALRVVVRLMTSRPSASQ